jgi:hypothetical protein
MTASSLGPVEITALHHVLDRQAIWDCLVRYARGVDRLDPELIRSAFWPDAHDSHGVMSGSPEEFLTKWLPTQADRETGQHFLANHTVDLHPDVAHAETYFMASMKDVGSDALRIVAGRYVDRFERRDGSWRIADRVVVLDWQCEADASGMQRALSGRVRGVRGAADPSYRHLTHRPAEGSVH